MLPFEYNHRNWPVNYMGNQLDSLLELKYIISVEESHVWLRSDLSIYFNWMEDKVTGGWKKYTPDFLIRDIRTNQARLIEIKPDGYNDIQRLRQFEKICTDHIAYFRYDWEFEVVFERDIQLTPEKQEQFMQMVANKNTTYHCYGRLQQNTFCVSDDAYKDMVINGMKPAHASPVGHSLRRSV